jgi:Terminase RNaseH-like domain
VKELCANRAQQQYDARAGQKNIVLKARQMGISTWIAARFFLDVITNKGLLAVQVAHDQQAAEEIFRIVHRFWANLPEEWRTGALRPSRSNIRQIVFPHLDSEYRVESAADLEAGRGLTIQRLHLSEVARWPGRADETLAGLRAAVAPQGEIVIESTPRGAAGTFYREWQSAADTGYVTHFFPWWIEESYRRPAKYLRPNAEEQELMRVHGLAREQIAYRRELVANYRGLAPQEFAEDPESCFLASGLCVFDIETIDTRLKNCEEYEEGEGTLHFLPARRDKEYVVAVDTAGGSPRGDYACIQVIDMEGAAQCAEYRGHEAPRRVAEIAVALAREYNNAVLAIEVNGTSGGETNAYARMQGYEYLYDDGRGFKTDVITRPAMISLVGEAVIAEPCPFQSKRLLRELRTFVRNDADRAEAAPGEHDDTVMAMGIALYVRQRLAQDQRRKRVN